MNPLLSAWIMQRWADKVDCPDTAIDALAVCDTDFFPNIGRLLQITATLPVTSASAERSFSVLKRLIRLTSERQWEKYA